MDTINKHDIVKRLGRVAVLMGGPSEEREISLISGNAVFAGLQRLGVDAVAIEVAPELLSAAAARHAGEDAPNLVEQLQKVRPDFVVNMLHGRIGEDGTVQGLLEMMGLPYTGSGVMASALSMNKVQTKRIWRQLGLSTAPFAVLDAGTDWQATIEELGSVVVKPVAGGSSLGIAICHDAAALSRQYSAAQNYDLRVFAESYVAGKEYSTGVIDGELLPTIELETDREFFDYEAKYIDDKTRVICPPRLSADKAAELEDLIKQAYAGLELEGLARIDVMQDRDGKFFLLEANTVPGMTSHSFVPLAAAAVGISFDELLLRMVSKNAERLGSN
jgi:D-alanine-D-alanine ligase